MPDSVQNPRGGPVWVQAKGDRALADLLDGTLSDPILSRVLLLHRQELFPTFNVKDNEITIFTMASPGFAYLTHSFGSTLRGFKKLDKKYQRYNPEGSQIQRAQEFSDRLSESVGPTLMCRLGVGALNTARTNASLRELVNSAEAVTAGRLKEAMGASDIDWLPLKNEFLAAIPQLMEGRRSRSALHQLNTHLDILKDTVDIQRFQAQVTELNINHYRKIVPGQRISEDRWREIVLDLHHYRFLEHVGPLCLWCTRCPETGVLALVKSSHIVRRFYCTRCRCVAQAATSFYPSGGLESALNLKDGMLAAAVGWQLTKRKVKFETNVSVSGTELDYLFEKGSGKALIECKMYQVLNEDDVLSRKILDADQQLREHIALANQQGMALTDAVCVVNVPNRRLKRLIRSVQAAPTRDPGFIGARVISYQALSSWLDRTLSWSCGG